MGRIQDQTTHNPGFEQRRAHARIVQTHGTIVIEYLHVAGMIKYHCLARAISDVGWGEFRRQLVYKTARYGRHLLLAPRFYPSSKQCSGCGAVKAELPLKLRVYRCESCGLDMDRDLNAARNLALLSTVVETGIHARGEPIQVTLPGNRLHDQVRLTENSDAIPMAKSLQKPTSF